MRCREYRVIRPLVWILAVLLATTSASARDDLPVDTLPNLWGAAFSAANSGRWADAALLFEALEHHFAGEPGYAAPHLQRSLLPRRAHARRITGDPLAAAADYAALVSGFPADPEVLLFRFQLADSLLAAGETSAAIDAFLTLADDPAAGSASAAGWLLAASHAEEAGRQNELQAWMDAVRSHSDTPMDLRAAANAILLADAIARHEVESIATIITAIAEFAAAPDPIGLDRLLDQAGAILLGAGAPGAALHADRLRPEPAVLEHLLAQRRAWFDAAPAPARLSPAETILNLTRRKLVAPAIRTGMPPDAHGGALAVRLIRRGQAWLRSGRPREAAATFGHVAGHPDFPANLRADAAYRRLVAWLDAAESERVLPAARALALDHPDSPLVPDALFLAAEALTRLGMTSEAREALDDLILLYPDHPSCFRWLYRRGRLHLATSDATGARADFLAAAALAPPGPFAEEARLQASVAAVAARQFELAQAELAAQRDRLGAGHPVRPDVLHRLATVAYAQDDLPLALATIETFLTEAPGHAREAEARLLRGDLRLGLGEALAAVADYSLIPPEAGPLHDHALFQTLRVYRALERDDLALRDLRRYLARTDPPPGRRAEAAAALADILRRQGNPETALNEAFALLLPILDDPAAAGVPSLLDLVARICEPIPPPDRPAPLAGGFAEWIDLERASAYDQGATVRYARLTLAAARRAMRLHPVEAECLLLELAGGLTPTEAGADALAAVGLQLLELEFPSARHWLQQLGAEFPRHPDGVVALYAQAWLAEYEDPAAAADGYAAFVAAAPRHSRTPEALLRLGRLRLETGQPEAAVTAFEDVLRRREARGRPHAEATAGLAAAAEAMGDPERALLYHQRTFTLHRAHVDLAAAAYLASARLLAERGDQPAAAATHSELLADPVLASATPGNFLPR